MKNIFVVLLTMAMLTMHGQVSWNSVEQVYQDLVIAIGDGSKIAPPIKSSKSESRVAYYSPSRQTIFVEEKFLEICAGFGSDSLNSLSFILGHELAHFYRNHGWVSTSGMGYVDTEMQADWKAIRKDKTIHAKDESEADIFSGFYALVAGYNAMPMAEKTLKTIYAVYGIKDSIPGYPTLSQRVEIAENAMDKSNDLFVLFNTAIYSLAIQNYQIAGRIFTHIYNQDYSGVEILNNLAIAEILEGYKMYGESPSYVYPLFISTETALDPDTRGNEGEEHIRKGISFLKEALKKEEKNPSILLNLASAYTMLNEFVDAEYYITKTEALNAENSGIECLRGIIALKKGDSKLAKKTWKGSRDKNEFIASNYATYFGKSEQIYSAGMKSDETPPVDAIILGDPNLSSKFKFKRIKLPGMKVSFTSLANSTLIEVYAGAGKSFRFQCFNNKNYENVEYSWETVLESNSGKIQDSQRFNILKIEDAKSAFADYVKYSKN